MTDSSPIDLSVVIPIYNEEENVKPLFDEVAAVMHGSEDRLGTWEILFIDDGSIDRSPQILRELKGADSHVRVIRLLQNSGQSAAFQAGFHKARGAIVITMDGDRQNDPADIPAMVSALEDHDLVCGIRKKRRDTWIRRISSKVGNGLRRTVTGDEIIDTGCSLKAFRRDILLRLPLFNGMHRFLGTLMGYAGGRINQIPVNHRERTAGQSKYGVWNRVWVTSADLMAVFWMRRRWLRYQVEELTS